MYEYNFKRYFNISGFHVNHVDSSKNLLYYKRLPESVIFVKQISTHKCINVSDLLWLCAVTVHLKVIH